ncbi:hypothetical protein [Aliikangiella sp. G2MR2-5]|uniref:hypothetical protein n=1 Tax=Aliikangiella sp. G2MR2-5 TaxID=2788943 RepID=UPI0018AC58CD|nr:hypothetical protein [Aliikangiella sp. G2MR2-5]
MSSQNDQADVTQTKQSKAPTSAYKIGLIMEQTRLVAADYRNTTGNALPVTAELARFDAVDKLHLKKVSQDEGVDALDPEDANVRYQIKGRVIFKGGKARQKLGQLNLESDWNQLLMVIYDADYQPSEIYKIDRKIIEQELENTQKDKRGSMTVAKYKAIGALVWAADS